MSGHRKSPTDRSALTNWRWQSEGLVRTRKEFDRVTPTHFLETAGRGTCQDTESTRPSEAHSQPGDGRGRGLSGHGKKHSRATCTHFLETAEGETCHNMERNRSTGAHSHAADGKGEHLSGCGKRPTERRPLTAWR